MQVKSLEEVHQIIAEYDAQHPGVCPVDQRRRQLREAEREQAREAREQQQASQNWEKWSDDRADARIYAAVQKDELLCDVIGDALGHERRGRGDIEILHSRTAFTTADESPRTYRPSPVPLKRAVA